MEHRDASHLLSESAHAGGALPMVRGKSSARIRAHSARLPRAHAETAPQLRMAAATPSLPSAASRTSPIRSVSCRTKTCAGPGACSQGATQPPCTGPGATGETTVGKGSLELLDSSWLVPPPPSESGSALYALSCARPIRACSSTQAPRSSDA